MKTTCEYFDVSQYLVRNARTLVKEKGILAVSEPKRGKSLPSETLSAVKKFYHDEEYSRQLPGKKDFVSVSKNVHVQKRLILCNLKELHSAFKSKHPRFFKNLFTYTKVVYCCWCTWYPLSVGLHYTSKCKIAAFSDKLKLQRFIKIYCV